jgi:taurine dioxygenase
MTLRVEPSGVGPDGDDPFIASIAGHPRVVEVRREADETTPVFAEAWHSDWSFLEASPAGTLLYGKIIPPVGGDTLFANQYAAYDALSAAMKSRISGLPIPKPVSAPIAGAGARLKSHSCLA